MNNCLLLELLGEGSSDGESSDGDSESDDENSDDNAGNWF